MVAEDFIRLQHVLRIVRSLTRTYDNARTRRISKYQHRISGHNPTEVFQATAWCGRVNTPSQPLSMDETLKRRQSMRKASEPQRWETLICNTPVGQTISISTSDSTHKSSIHLTLSQSGGMCMRERVKSDAVIDGWGWVSILSFQSIFILHIRALRRIQESNKPSGYMRTAADVV